MIKRAFVSLCLLMCLGFAALANKELTIKLDSKERSYCEKTGFAHINFEYLYSDRNIAWVRVTVENITGNPPHALLMFRTDMAEQSLKKGKPKIVYEKTYPGKKGTRIARGCRESNKPVGIIVAAETAEVFTIEVPLTSSKDFILPLYEAKYKARDMYKKGKDRINYSILEEHIYDVHIEVVGWSEDDPTYVNTKTAVEELITSLEGVEFCYHKKHKPSLKEQQRPYQEKKDNLIGTINNILDSSDWMSTDEPHKAYSKLLVELEAIDLNKLATVCKTHKAAARAHSCSYCRLSAQDIYHRLDDLYQQLHAGKIAKEQALKTAKALHTCYKQSAKRKKDSSYSAKITRFYNSIANY